MIYSAHIGLSYTCNLKCRHCFVKKNKDNGFVLKNFDSIIEGLYSRGLSYIIYTYGEPFLVKNFISIVEKTSNKNIVQTIMTNGTQITEQVAKRISNIPNLRIMLSLDSYIANEHDFRRSEKGTFNRVINAINLFNKYGQKFGVATTVNIANQNRIYGLLRLAEKYHINYLSLLRMREGLILGNIDKNSEYMDVAEKYYSDQSKFGGKKIIFHDIELIPYLKERQVLNYNIVRENSCLSNENIAIQPNGLYSKCNFSDPMGCLSLNTDYRELDSKLSRRSVICKYASF